MAGARNWAGIVAGAGPSVLKNNVVLGCRTGGLLAYDYNGWGLLYDILIEGNTCACNNGYDLAFRNTESARPNLEVLNNTVISRPDVTGLEYPGKEAFPGRWENNLCLSSIIELEQLVEKLMSVTCRPAMTGKVYTGLKEGPFDIQDLVGLIKQLV